MDSAKITMTSQVIKPFLAGSLSGTCSILLFQPLDLIKTRLQVAAAISMPMMSSKGGVTVNSATCNIIRTIVQNDSFLGLWKGSSPSFYRCVPGVGIYFSTLHGLKMKFFKERKPTSKESLVLGAGARTFATVCLLPMTVVKTRFESGKFGYRSIVEALSKIHEKEGAKGFYRGLTATLLRDAPFSGFYLMFYNTTKNLVPDGGTGFKFGCGVVSGALASLLSQPADVIKTNIQINQTSLSMPQVIYNVYKDHGILGYFRGIAPRVTRRTLMAALTWTVYEQVAAMLKL